MKKINCKNGLDHKQEIEARRLRKALEENSKVIEERLCKLYKNYGLTKTSGGFYTYIKENDIILYSAFERAGGVYQLNSIMRSYGFFVR